MFKLKLQNKHRSILFFVPDYHCSFFLRDELRRRGWRADIFVPHWYPTQFLYREDAIREKIRYSTERSLRNAVRLVLAIMLQTTLVIKYRYIVRYGSLNYDIGPTKFSHRCLLILLSLWYRLIRVCGTKIIYLPSGCREHVSKKQWMGVDQGRVCGSCGYEPSCNDKTNHANFYLVRQFASTSIVMDGHRTHEFQESRIRYKSFDLETYSPNLHVPPEHQWPKFDGVRILHSHALDTRKTQNRNIKGTPSIVQAVEALKEDGHNVALMNLSGIPSSEMRFHQVQADIVIDQLIYGGYGSTTLECMALGKPVICYIRPSWRTFLSSIYPEWEACPVVSATPDTLHEELRKLIVDGRYREQLAKESREFALKFLNVKKNVTELEKLLLSLE